MKFSQLGAWFERAEKMHARISFIGWVVGLPAVLSAFLSGYWAQAHEAPWLLVGLTAFGGLCATILVVLLIFVCVLRVKDKIENKEIPLRTAAKIMYERLQSTDIAGIAEREGKTPDGILEWFGDHLVLHSPISAERLPSTRHFELSEEERRYLTVKDGCKTIVGALVGDPVRYANPTIKKNEIEKSMELLRVMMSEPINKC